MRPKRSAPVFILGSPRSGTTLLYHMLLSAGGFAVYRSETHVFNLLAPRFGQFRTLANRRALMDTWLQSMFFKRSGLDASELRARIAAECTGPGDFLRSVMGRIAQDQQVERWADCTPQHVLHIREIKHAIPEALIIHIIRDGRDVALSLEKLDWIRPLPGDRGDPWLVAGYFWDWMVKAGRRSGAEFPQDYLEVGFEKLLQDPDTALDRMGEFIDHDLDYERIRRVSIGSLSEPNTSFDGVADEGRFNPVGRWRGVVSSDRVAGFEAALGDSLMEFGYELATAPDQRNTPAASRVRRKRSLYQAFYSGKEWAKAHLPMSGRWVDTGLLAP
jgi:hypothetical protein